MTYRNLKRVFCYIDAFLLIIVYYSLGSAMVVGFLAGMDIPYTEANEFRAAFVSLLIFTWFHFRGVISFKNLLTI